MGDEKILAQYREMEQARDELSRAGRRLRAAEEDKAKAQTRFYKAQSALRATVKIAEGFA
jgi:hypothetical protein